MPLGLGLGLNNGSAVPAMAGGGAISTKAPLGSLISPIGDGTASEGAAGGPRNMWNRLLELFGPRVIPTIHFNCHKSGDTVAAETARIPYWASQLMGIAIIGSKMHIEGVLALDPDVDATRINQWKTTVQAEIDAVPFALKIFVCTTIGSTLSGENTASTFNASISVAQRVRDLMLAFVLGLAQPDRIIPIDLWAIYNFSNAAAQSTDSGASYTHPANVGADNCAAEAFRIMDPHITSATLDEMSAMLIAGTFPGMGANLDTDTLMQGGTTGTKTGTGAALIFGNVPTGKRIDSAILDGTSFRNDVSIDQSPGSYYKQVNALTGIPAARSSFSFLDTANITVTGSTKGQYAYAFFRVKMSKAGGGNVVGLHSYGATFGNFGTFSNSADLTTTITPLTRDMDTIVCVPPKPFYSSNGPFAAAPQFQIRMDQVANDNVAIFQRPTLHIPTSTRTAGPMRYLGRMGITSANYLIRLTGSLAAGLVIETGTWNLAGFLETDFAERRVYKGGSGGDAGVGTGTLLGTLTKTGVNWTLSNAELVAAGCAAADQLFLEITGNNGIGSPDIARSATAFVL